jgi:hypothetical protein
MGHINRLFFLIALCSCTAPSLSTKVANQKIFEAAERKCLTHSSRMSWNIIQSVERANGDYLHLWAEEWWSLHPAPTNKTMVVGLEHEGSMRLLGSREAHEIFSRDQIDNPEEAGLWCLALESSLLASLIEFPKVSWEKTAKGFVVRIESRGRYSGSFMNVDSFDSLSGRTASFFWEDGRLVRMVQEGFPALSSDQQDSAQKTLRRLFPESRKSVERLLRGRPTGDYGNSRELVSRGITWRDALPGTIEDLNIFEYSSFQIWRGNLVSGNSLWTVEGVFPGIPGETYFHDLLFEVRSMGPYSYRLRSDWAVFCAVAGSHDWLISSLADNVECTLVSQQERELEYSVSNGAGKVFGALHLRWNAEHWPEYEFIWKYQSVERKP